MFTKLICNLYLNIIEINILFILNLDLLSAPCNFQGFEVNILNIPFVVNCGRGKKREYIGKALRDARMPSGNVKLASVVIGRGNTGLPNRRSRPVCPSERNNRHTDNLSYLFFPNPDSYITVNFTITPRRLGVDSRTPKP